MRNRILPLLRQSPSGIDANPAFGLGLYTFVSGVIKMIKTETGHWLSEDFH